MKIFELYPWLSQLFSVDGSINLTTAANRKNDIANQTRILRSNFEPEVYKTVWHILGTTFESSPEKISFPEYQEMLQNVEALNKTSLKLGLCIQLKDNICKLIEEFSPNFKMILKSKFFPEWLEIHLKRQIVIYNLSQVTSILTNVSKKAQILPGIEYLGDWTNVKSVDDLLLNFFGNVDLTSFLENSAKASLYGKEVEKGSFLQQIVVSKNTFVKNEDHWIQKNPIYTSKDVEQYVNEFHEIHALAQEEVNRTIADIKSFCNRTQSTTIDTLTKEVQDLKDFLREFDEKESAIELNLLKLKEQLLTEMRSLKIK